MKTLTDQASSEWLASRGIMEDPYRSGRSPFPHYAQFSLPKDAGRLSVWFRTMVARAMPYGEALVHVLDWAHYTPDQMAVVDQIRRASGESLWLIKTPGHVFDASESDLLIGFCSLVTAYEWSAYLYFDNGLTVFSWEGAILDIWTGDGDFLAEIREEFEGGSATDSAPPV